MGNRLIIDRTKLRKYQMSDPVSAIIGVFIRRIGTVCLSLRLKISFNLFSSLCKKWSYDTSVSKFSLILHSTQTVQSAAADHLKKDSLCIVLCMVCKCNFDPASREKLLTLRHCLFIALVTFFPCRFFQSDSFLSCKFRHIFFIYITCDSISLTQLFCESGITPAFFSSDSMLHVHRTKLKRNIFFHLLKYQQQTYRICTSGQPCKNNISLFYEFFSLNFI